jgi:hypothetical protein
MKIIINAVKNNKMYGYGFNKKCSGEQIQKAINTAFNQFDYFSVNYLEERNNARNKSV